MGVRRVVGGWCYWWVVLFVGGGSMIRDHSQSDPPFSRSLRTCHLQKSKLETYGVPAGIPSFVRTKRSLASQSLQGQTVIASTAPACRRPFSTLKGTTPGSPRAPETLSAM
eukprot:762583-Hanusia_phi.AAC.2